jgi:hypothetical protein
MDRWSRSRLFAYWYAAIGAGFFLLGLNRILVGGVPWLIVLRFVISAGFFLLAWMQYRGMLDRR